MDKYNQILNWVKSKIVWKTKQTQNKEYQFEITANSWWYIQRLI